MSNFEKVTSLFLILIGLSESLIHTPSVPFFIVLRKRSNKKCFEGDRFELMSKKKKKVKKEKPYHLELRKGIVIPSLQDCYADKTGKYVYPTLRLAVPPETGWVSEHITEAVL